MLNFKRELISLGEQIKLRIAYSKAILGSFIYYDCADSNLDWICSKHFNHSYPSNEPYPKIREWRL